MSRALIIINSDLDRRRAAQWCQKAPDGCRVEFKEAKRTTDQNSLLWARLTDVAAQAKHNGRKYPADVWKCLFMSALGREIQFIPALDGKSFLPLGLSSSDLSKAEMSELLDFIAAWGAENNITFHDMPAPEQQQAAG
jgi:hypothetical protein